MSLIGSDQLILWGGSQKNHLGFTFVPFWGSGVQLGTKNVWDLGFTQNISWGFHIALKTNLVTQQF